MCHDHSAGGAAAGAAPAAALKAATEPLRQGTVTAAAEGAELGTAAPETLPATAAGAGEAAPAVPSAGASPPAACGSLNTPRQVLPLCSGFQRSRRPKPFASSWPYSPVETLLMASPLTYSRLTCRGERRTERVCRFVIVKNTWLQSDYEHIASGRAIQ